MHIKTHRLFYFLLLALVPVSCKDQPSKSSDSPLSALKVLEENYPAPQPYTFDLKNLFGKQEFRRLKGSSAQDTVTNNGAMAEDIVQLQGEDALFLVKVH